MMSWFDANWQHKALVTIDHTKVGSGGVTNFPVLVTEANVPTNFWSEVKAAGADIRCVALDDATEINFELVSIDTSGDKLEMWVLMSALSSSADTNNKFYLYWGNAGASAKAASWGQGVWTNYAGVWHMQATAWSGTPGEVTDSSGAGVVGQAVGDATPAAAVIGTGLSAAAGGRITLPNVSPCIPGGANGFSMSFWVYSTTASEWQGLLHFANSSHGYAIFHRYFSGGGFKYEFMMRNSLREWQINTPILNNGWHMVTVVYDNGTVKMYRDTTLDQTITGVGAADPPGAIAGSIGGQTAGLIDEARFAKTARPAAQVTTDYNSQSSPSTFYSMGAEQNVLATANGNFFQLF